MGIYLMGTNYIQFKVKIMHTIAIGTPTRAVPTPNRYPYHLTKTLPNSFSFIWWGREHQDVFWFLLFASFALSFLLVHSKNSYIWFLHTDFSNDPSLSVFYSFWFFLLVLGCGFFFSVSPAVKTLLH